MRYKPVTIWYLFDLDKRDYVFHHVDFGRIETAKPTPRTGVGFKKGSRFRKKYAVMDDKTGEITPDPF